MKLLVLNSGSSSIKYKLYEAGGSMEVLAEGVAERVGVGESFIKHKPTGKDNKKVDVELPDHKKAIDEVLKLLVDEEVGVIKQVNEITGVGHRVVHGGEDFADSVVITDEVVEAIKKNAVLAPLHNPPNLLGVEAVSHVLPDVPQVAVFDTAIHQSMPAKAFMYGLPREYYDQHKIRRYGFHGTSHGYVSKKAAEQYGKPLEDIRVITCHIGNGISLAAFMDGKSVDTSMGLTPLEGAVMGTRSGDMDPYIPLHIMQVTGMSASEVSTLMNKKSGMLALSGHSDMRDVEEGYQNGDDKCTEALEIYAYRIQKYIGAYAAAMGGVDAIVFTAGVGENSPILRQMVLENFAFMGVKLDVSANETRGTTVISKSDSTVAVYVIPTNEELVIATDTLRLISGK